MSFVATVTLKTKHVLQHRGTEGVAADSGSAERRAVLRRKPARAPTADEVRKHWATYLPFCSWCKGCVISRTKLEVVMRPSMNILKCIGTIALLGIQNEESMWWCLSVETEAQR